MRIPPAALLLSILTPAIADPVVIGHPGMPSLSQQRVERIYTGRVVEVDGERITPINLPPGNSARERFLRDYLAQDEDKYTGYWTVRRYVGKGTPPRELDSAAAVLDFVSKTPGAIGYVDEAEVRADVAVLLKK